MSHIHPSALVDPHAYLGNNVSVGAYAIVGPNVTIGDGCTLEPYAHIVKNVSMGCENKVCGHSVLGGAPQIAGTFKEGTLEIGNYNIFRESSTINLGSDRDSGVTKVGSYNFLMAYSHIGHDSQLGNHIIMANSSHLGGHVIVHDRVFLGGGTLVHQFVRIGKGAFTAGGCVLINDLPPYCMAAHSPARAVGLNVIGMRRLGMDKAIIKALREAFRLILQKREPLADDKTPTKLLTYKEVRAFVDFIKNSRRGCIRT